MVLLMLLNAKNVHLIPPTKLVELALITTSPPQREHVNLANPPSPQVDAFALTMLSMALPASNAHQPRRRGYALNAVDMDLTSILPHATDVPKPFNNHNVLVA